MDKIILNDLNNLNTINLKEVEILGNKVFVKDYLPMKDKLNIAELVLQNSIDYGFINDIKVEAFFNVYVVAKYTNIDLKDFMDNIYNAYDLVEKSGLLQAVVDTANDDYNILYDYVMALVEKFERYQSSLSGIVDRVLNELPERMESITSQLENLDTNKIVGVFDEVMKNGGSENAILQTITGQKQ